MAQLCNRLRLHAIVAFLRAKGGLKRVEIGASGGRRRRGATKGDDYETNAALFRPRRRHKDGKPWNFGASPCVDTVNTER